MNISLLPELQKLVNEKVQSGEYGSRDEVFHAALRLLKERSDQADDPHDFTKRAPLLLAEAERKRREFTVLAEEWARATQHLSLVQKKIIHPAYFRIVGMGEAAVPLLLEALRDRPAHWFAALRAITNCDPSPPEANPSAAREAWLEWGQSQGLIKLKMAKEDVEADLPALRSRDYELSDEDFNFNCLAYALGDQTNWWAHPEAAAGIGPQDSQRMSRYKPPNQS